MAPREILEICSERLQSSPDAAVLFLPGKENGGTQYNASNRQSFLHKDAKQLSLQGKQRQGQKQTLQA